MKRIKKKNILLIIYTLVSLFGFYSLGLPSLLGEIPIQTYSDSLRYEYFSKNLYDELPLISFASNMFGPVYILRFFDYNYIYIYMFNITIFYISIKLILENHNLKSNVLLFFLFMSPLMYFSLFNVNKEILTLLSISLFTVYIKNLKLRYLILSLFVAFMVKWQLVIFLIFAAVSVVVIKKRYLRFLSVLSLILILSIAYPILAKTVLLKVVEHSHGSVDISTTGSGIFPLLNNIQTHYGGYIIAVIPKFLQINFGIIARIEMLGTPAHFWNYFVLLLHSVIFFLLFLLFIYKKGYKINNDLYYVSILYIAFFAITPIINVRYFFPVYIFWIIIISQSYTNSRLVKNENIAHHRKFR